MDLLNKVTLDTLALFLIAFSIFWVGWQLERIRRRPDGYRKESSERLAILTNANFSLLSSVAGRKAVVEFMLSEAALQSYMEDVSARMREQVQPTIEELIIVVPEEAEKEGIVKKGMKWFAKNREKLLEKLFGKINGVVKKMIPGLGGDEDDDDD